MTTLRKPRRIHNYQGEGITDVIKGAVDTVVNPVKNVLNSITYERYPGETHIRSGLSPNGQPYSYAGPGTNLARRLERHTGLPKRSSQPINGIDAAAMRHDIRYGQIADEYYKDPTPENKKRQMKEIHKEGDIF